MVNYCCVLGCGRNSKSSKHLYYYSVPKEPRRQQHWLESAGRSDLLDKPPAKRILYRFCSRHFSPASIKNKHLCADAVPTLCLPGSGNEEPANVFVEEQLTHHNISCDNCGIKITGYRYKCVSCPNYDLCSRCEMAETHDQHFMLRIPAPTKFKLIENMVKKWQECYTESLTDNSSDDEPITKYAKNYDSGVDLSEDVKVSIRKEVSRVLKQKNDIKKKKQVVSQKRSSENDKSSKKQKIESVDLSTLCFESREMEFEDINVMRSVEDNQQNDIKTELLNFKPQEEPAMPMIQMKLSEDLSQLIMEVSDQRTVYSFPTK